MTSIHSLLHFTRQKLLVHLTEKETGVTGPGARRRWAPGLAARAVPLAATLELWDWALLDPDPAFLPEWPGAGKGGGLLEERAALHPDCPGCCTQGYTSVCSAYMSLWNWNFIIC